MARDEKRRDPGEFYPGGKVWVKPGQSQPQLDGAVQYDREQTLTDAQKEQAQKNIGMLGKLPLRPLPKYLQALAFDDTCPADAEAFYATLGGNRVLGGCSIVRKGGLVGGNFDYPYDDACSFAIKVSAVKGANADGSDRHASIGMAYVGTLLTENAVASGVYSPLYRVLPGMTESGINDAGVYAKINVIPRDESKDPVQSSTRTINALAVVRYVLDHFDNAADAATYIAAHYYIPEGSADSYHWVIADVNGTHVVEDGNAQYMGGAPYALTNHRVMTSDTYGNGYERRSVLATQSTVESALSAARFTNAYADGWPWPDEFAGQTDAQGMIPYDATDRLRAWADEHVAPLLDENRKPAARGNGCWQTVHSAIYDFASKTMKVAVQETDEWFTFAVDANGVTEVAWEDVKNKPTAFPPSSHTHPQSQVEGLADALAAKRGMTDRSWGTIQIKPEYLPLSGVDHIYEWYITLSNDKSEYELKNDFDTTIAIIELDGVLLWSDPDIYFGSTSAEDLYGVKIAFSDTLALTSEVPAPVTLEDSVTHTSANPVKSSGIWSAIWGALTALPAGFSSLYDLCVAKLGEKRDKTDLAITERRGTGPWMTFGNILSGEWGSPHGTLNRLKVSSIQWDDGFWYVLVDGSTDGGETWIPNSSVINLNEPYLRAQHAHSLRLVGEVSDVSGETHLDFGTATRASEDVVVDTLAKYSELAEKANASDIFGNDGKPTDTFATGLMEKQVAKDAIAYKVATSAGENRSVLAVEIDGTETDDVNVIVPAPESNKVTDFEVWVKVAAGVATIPQINFGRMVEGTFTPVALIKKGGENPAYEKDATSPVTNIIHFTAKDASGYTVIAAAFK